MADNESTVVTVAHPHGLHLRFGKDVVETACRFESTITARNLTRQSPTVNVKSILQLLQLQAREGHQLELSADGPDAPAALEALTTLLSLRPEAPAHP